MAALPASSQAFEIVLKNNDIVRGKMRGTFVDRGGIHVFKLFDTKHVVRLFFPAVSILSSQLGELLGEVLVEQKKAASEAVDNALKAQKQHREKLFGEYLLETGLIEAEQLKYALALQQDESSAHSNAILHRKLGEILVSEGFISQHQLDEVLQQQRSNRKRKIGEYLVEMGVTTNGDVNRELARKVGLPFIKLDAFKPTESAIKLVPKEIAQKYQLFPLRIEQGRLLVAVDDPLNKEAIDILQFVTNLHLELLVASSEDITAAIHQYERKSQRGGR